MPEIQATYIEVSAEVRYWEDAKINGLEDASGDLVPFRCGDLWCPVIRLEDGMVMDQAWRSTTMAPLCPHCNAGLLPEDVARGVATASKALIRKRREKSNPA